MIFLRIGMCFAAKYSAELDFGDNSVIIYINLNFCAAIYDFKEKKRKFSRPFY